MLTVTLKLATPWPKVNASVAANQRPSAAHSSMVVALEHPSGDVRARALEQLAHSLRRVSSDGKNTEPPGESVRDFFLKRGWVIWTAAAATRKFFFQPAPGGPIIDTPRPDSFFLSRWDFRRVEMQLNAGGESSGIPRGPALRSRSMVYIFGGSMGGGCVCYSASLSCKLPCPLWKCTCSVTVKATPLESVTASGSR